jgi:hypothetical protein
MVVGRKPTIRAKVLEAMDRPRGCWRWMTKGEISRAIGQSSPNTCYHVEALAQEGRLEVREWSNRFTDYRLRDET